MSTIKDTLTDVVKTSMKAHELEKKLKCYAAYKR